MEDGWIKLWRKVKENAIFKDDALFKCWVYCLLEATHTEMELLIGGQIIKIMPGQFVSGRDKANKELNWKGIKFDRKMKFLEKHGFLNRQVNSQFTLNTIIKWDTYQGAHLFSEQASEQGLNRDRTGTEQGVNTYKNVKNDKNVKNKDKIARSDKPKRAIALADNEFIQALKENPAYEGIDIDREIGKVDAWLLTPRGRGKQKTRQRIVNWLNRAEKPMVSFDKPPTDETDRLIWEMKKEREKKDGYIKSFTELH